MSARFGNATGFRLRLCRRKLKYGPEMLNYPSKGSGNSAEDRPASPFRRKAFEYGN
jgi:hypothetical protein